MTTELATAPNLELEEAKAKASDLNLIISFILTKAESDLVIEKKSSVECLFHLMFHYRSIAKEQEPNELIYSPEEITDYIDDVCFLLFVMPDDEVIEVGQNLFNTLYEVKDELGLPINEQ